MGGLEAKVVCHLILQCLDLGRVKLDHPATVGADHMIVMFMIKVMFVVSLVIAEANFTREPGLGQ